MGKLFALMVLALFLLGFNSVSYADEKAAETGQQMADKDMKEKKKKAEEEDEEPECD